MNKALEKERKKNTEREEEKQFVQEIASIVFTCTLGIVEIVASNAISFKQR